MVPINMAPFTHYDLWTSQLIFSVYEQLLLLTLTSLVVSLFVETQTAAVFCATGTV